ncbi:MAG TPA: hypothetical protein GYA08_25395 [Chloroflexi bacterium]|nr:hypothetical protein [Chloroflexota bacterium]
MQHIFALLQRLSSGVASRGAHLPQWRHAQRLGAAGALLMAIFTALTLSAAAQGQAPTPPCAPADITCDGRIDVADLQRIAAAAQTPAQADARFDVNGDGAIDVADLEAARARWRGALNASTTAGRFGYAVDDAGNVYLRWQLATSVYTTPVEVLREPAPAGAPAAGVGAAGIVATVSPITDDATALPLLGEHWETLRNGYETDANGDPIPLATVAQVHTHVQAGDNPMLVEWLANREPGVARVFALGYLDTNFSGGGVHRYWIRQGATLLGPVDVDTTARTRLPNPGGLAAFDAAPQLTANLTAQVGGAPNSALLARAKREAHANIYLSWNPELGLPETDPVWHNGFNVYRRTCDPGPTNCGGWERVNEYPIFPQPLPAEAGATEDISGGRLAYGLEVHEFDYEWADFDLDTSRIYCYTVTSLDLLQQDGVPSPEACLQPPDYRPPGAPDLLRVETIYNGKNTPATVNVVYSFDPSVEGNADWQSFALYRAATALAVWPDEWTLVRQVTPDRCSTEMVMSDVNLGEHQNFWYRVVAIDRVGNMSSPSAPRVSRIDDIYPPAAPTICAADVQGKPVNLCFPNDVDVTRVNVYRKFAADGVALLVGQVPVSGANFAWSTWSDDYAPVRETEFFYEVRGIDEAGNLGAASTFALTRTLSTGVAQKLIPPALISATIDAGRTGQIVWTTAGEANLRRFHIYRGAGDTAPALSAMTKIGEVAVNRHQPDQREFTFSDPSTLAVNEVYWYAVEAEDHSGARSASAPFPARYVELDDPSAPPLAQFPLQAIWADNPDPEPDGVQLLLENPNGSGRPPNCCYIVFRSRAPDSGFAPITPIIPLQDRFYLDTDVHPGDVAYYQVVRILAGEWVGAAILTNTATGEIVAASDVVQATGIPAKPLNTSPHTPPDAGVYVPLPGDPPATLRFGAWDVRVTNYTNKTAGNLSGVGKVTLQPAAGANVEVKVSFSNVDASASGAVNSGSATVLLGTMGVTYSDRVRYTVSNMTLTSAGATATVRIVDFGPDFTLYDLGASGPGQPVEVASTNVFVSDTSLRFNLAVAVSQTCATPRTSLAFPFAVRDWSLVVAPTNNFTVSETGVQFGATCTLYRDRYSGRVEGGILMPAALDYRNDSFLNRQATSLEAASYTVANGLSGQWGSLGATTYTTAFPFGVEIGSSGLTFHFTNRVFTQGTLTGKPSADDLSVTYRRNTYNNVKNTFVGNFTTAPMVANGAISATITASTGVEWVAYGVNGGVYTLYTPPVYTPGRPGRSWRVSLGKSASGLSGDGRVQPGLNAFNQTFTWTACPTPASPAQPAFAFAPGSDVDLFVRWQGVSGVVDMKTTTGGVAMTLADYQWRFTRFAQSWLANFPYANANAGNIYLPYPADATFQFDQLNLNEAGCVTSGSLLPIPEDLNYWQLPITPWTLFFDAANKLWIEFETEITNLERVDGGAGQPQLEIAAAFNPNGAFYDGDAYPEDTVYTVDDFYVVMKDIAFSGYDPVTGNREQPNWNKEATLALAPCLPQQSGCTPTPGLEGGFIKLSAGVYLPFFGEATDPNSDAMFLLAAHPYIGFNRRPLAEHLFSPALDIQLQYEMIYAQSQAPTMASRWLALATSQGRDISVLDNALVEVSIAEIPNALVIEPNSERIFFGFPSATGVLLAADEAWNTLPGNSPAPSQAALEERFRSWCSSSGSENGPLFSLFGAGWDCNLEAKLAAYFVWQEGFNDYRTLIDDIDAKAYTYSGNIAAWLTDPGFGDVHVGLPLFQQKLANSPLQLQWVRGDGVIEPVTDGAGRVIDGKLALLETAAFVTVYNAGRNDPEVKKLLSGNFAMNWDADGEIYLAVTNLQTTMAELDVRLDADLRLLFDYNDLGYGIEGGITLYDVVIPLTTVNKAGAVAGFTVDNNAIKLLYTGATFDLWLELEALGLINAGGSFLFGRLDPTSPVLQREYGDVMAALDPEPGMIVQGAYMQLYANNIPIFDVLGSCPGVRISGGGETAYWIFNEVGQPSVAWGVRLGVNATGKALCVAAVKASVTLQLDNGFGENNLDLSGDAWAGAGCGFCEVSTWITQDDVRNDGGCLKCILTLDFLIPLAGSTTEPDFNFRGECPF